MQSITATCKDIFMKKHPLLATLGVAGACAACCAIPLAVPLLTGLSVAGVTVFDWQGWIGSNGWALPAGAGIGTALLVGVALWIARKRRASACASPLGTSAAKAGGCGCGPRSAQ